MNKKMFVDLMFQGKICALCTLDLQKPGAVIEVSGEGADSVEHMLKEGLLLVENGKYTLLTSPKDDVRLMSSMFMTVNGSMWRASVAYFDDEKPVDPY